MLAGGLTALSDSQWQYTWRQHGIFELSWLSATTAGVRNGDVQMVVKHALSACMLPAPYLELLFLA
jgi:hypothetical protein